MGNGVAPAPFDLLVSSNHLKKLHLPGIPSKSTSKCSCEGKTGNNTPVDYGEKALFVETAQFDCPSLTLHFSLASSSRIPASTTQSPFGYDIDVDCDRQVTLSGTGPTSVTILPSASDGTQVQRDAAEQCTRVLTKDANDRQIDRIVDTHGSRAANARC